jgi:hypothetical protein
VKRAALIAVLLLVAASGATTARADGDPASDILYVQDVFVPFPKPTPTATAALETAVTRANDGGMRLKVAVLASQTDMGTARSLFNRPADYAKFLGFELSYNYDGVLLVVMPAGFGVYKKDASTTTYEHAVSSVSALGKKDVDHAAPRVQALAVRAKRGARADLVYDVNDNSGRSRETVKVYSGKRVVATIHSAMESSHGGTLDTVHWRVPAHAAAAYRFCVVATDPTGNASRPSCAAIRVS